MYIVMIGIEIVNFQDPWRLMNWLLYAPWILLPIARVVFYGERWRHLKHEALPQHPASASRATDNGTHAR
jgi:hypothetical protein